MLKTPEKRVSERKLYTMSLAEQDEIKIDGQVIATIDSIIGSSDLTVEDQTAAHDDAHVQVWISDGVVTRPGLPDHVIFIVTTDAGSRLVGDGKLKIIPD